jgi:cation-transporting ATPase 13A1
MELQKKRFFYSTDKKTFIHIPFPINNEIGYYQNAEGLLDQTEMKKADMVYGMNRMDVPIPKFFDIYKEHLVAPFFVFQIFCSVLWLMDEYWYFSLMTLFMLFIFEGTVVMQRLQNMKRLRSMRIAPQDIHVYRFGKWMKIMSDELYPGEIILLKKNHG